MAARPVSVRSCLLLVAMLGAAARLEAQAAPDPADLEPTAAETLALELLNRFRADPKLEAERLAKPTPDRAVAADLDWQMFKAELAALPPSPPLVFDPRLQVAARRHARYVVKHRTTGHAEEAGKEGFSGAGESERAKAAGYDAGVIEITSNNVESVAAAHFAMVVDDQAGGPGGMREGRPHRGHLINPQAREVGIALVPNGVTGPAGEHSSLVVLLGRHDDRRRAGGVVYLDQDEDGAYDPGEGVGGAVVAVGEAAAVTWPSGAFVLALEDAKAATFRAALRGQKREAALGRGAENAAFAVDLWPAISKRIESLTVQLEKSGPESASGRKAAADLWALAEGLSVAAPLRERIAALTAAAGRAVEADREAVLAALDRAQDKELASVLSKARTSYRGTAAETFFADAERAGKTRKAVQDLEAQAARGFVAKKPLEKAEAELASARAATAHPGLRRVLDDLDARLRTLARGSGQ